jgi:hypothetical protein
MNTAYADTSAHPPVFPVALTSSADPNTNYVIYEPAAPLSSFASPDGCILVHTCTYCDVPKRNCHCDVHVTEDDAARLIARGRAREYLYTRTVKGQPVVCQKKDAIIATVNLSDEIRRIEQGEAEKRFRLAKQRQRERDAAYQRFLDKWGKRVRTLLAKSGYFTEATDDDLARACEYDESGKWNGLIPSHLVRSFDSLLSDFWSALLDRENLSIYRGEKATGATNWTIPYGIRIETADFLRGLEVDTDGRRVEADGEEPDAYEAPEQETYEVADNGEEGQGEEDE